MKLTILMPCLNEKDTILDCVREAQEFLRSRAIDGEVLVVDNGCTDWSPIIALDAGARVEYEPEKGYGNAVRRGIREAQGDYIIMGDCDGSYDFSDLDDILCELENGSMLCMGNRFKGGIEPGAMPLLHRIGVPILSSIARCRVGKTGHRVCVGDFHCGLRGMNTRFMQELDFTSGGMEFATEMIVQTALKTDKITEVPVLLRKDKRVKTKKHLRTFRDGLRHLRYIRAISVNVN
jgi:glycosyltransferase involved in cell wall biosynthesis